MKERERYYYIKNGSIKRCAHNVDLECQKRRGVKLYFYNEAEEALKATKAKTQKPTPKAVEEPVAPVETEEVKEEEKIEEVKEEPIEFVVPPELLSPKRRAKKNR